MKVKKKWEISEKLLKLTKESNYYESLCDNMLIFKDGMVEHFAEECDLIETLDRQYLSQDVENVIHIVAAGEKVDFKLVDRIKMSTEVNSFVMLEEYALPDVINNYDYIVVLNTPGNELFTFSSKKEMAEYLSTADKGAILHVFVNKELQDIERCVVLVLLSGHEHSVELEFEDSAIFF